MIIGVQGTSSFEDYNVFLRAMAVAMSGMKSEDKFFDLYTAGPVKVNSMVSEFVNVSERGMKSRGKKIRSFKVPPSWIEDNMESINYLAFFSKPKENASHLVKIAEEKNVEVGIFRY
jgi:hypothetical protein